MKKKIIKEQVEQIVYSEVENTYWISKDSTKFISKDDCKKYEKQIKKEKARVDIYDKIQNILNDVIDEDMFCLEPWEVVCSLDSSNPYRSTKYMSFYVTCANESVKISVVNKLIKTLKSIFGKCVKFDWCGDISFYFNYKKLKLEDFKCITTYLEAKKLGLV